MAKKLGDDVYTVHHFVFKDGDWQFAGFQGVYSTRTGAENGIRAHTKIKDGLNAYLSLDKKHRWEIGNYTLGE